MTTTTTSSSSPTLSATTIAARLDRIPTGRFHLKVASIVGAGTFFDGFDAISLAVVLTLVVGAFKVNFAIAGLIVAAGYVGQFVGAILIGALSDRIGRKRAFIAALIVFSATAILCALAWDATSLLIFRAIQGIGLGAEVPIAGTIINELVNRRHRGRVAVVYESLFTWGLFFAPIIALVLTSTAGPMVAWRLLFGLGVLPIIVAVWAIFALPESPRWLAERGRLADADAIVTRMEQSAVARGGVLPDPEVRAEVVQKPFRGREIFSGIYRRRTILLAIIWFCTFFVTYGFTVWLPSIYIAVGGLPPTSSLVLTIILGAIQVVMAYVVALLVDRVGRKPIFILGFAIAVVGGIFGAVNILVLHNTAWPVLFATGVIFTVGIMLPTVSLYLYTGELYPTRVRGFGTSAVSSMSRVASVISPSIFGFLLDGHGGAGAIFSILGGVALIGMLTMAIGGIETRRRQLEEISN